MQNHWWNECNGNENGKRLYLFSDSLIIPGRSKHFAGLRENRVEFMKTLVRLRKVEAGDKTKLELRKVRGVNGCKQNIEKLIH